MRQMAIAKNVLLDAYGEFRTYCLWGTLLTHHEGLNWEFRAALVRQSVVYVCRYKIQWGVTSGRFRVSQWIQSELPGSAEDCFLLRTIGLDSSFAKVAAVPNTCWLFRCPEGHQLWIDLPNARKRWRISSLGLLSNHKVQLYDFERELREKIDFLLGEPGGTRAR
jgi:hypothetical protein